MHILGNQNKFIFEFWVYSSIFRGPVFQFPRVGNPDYYFTYVFFFFFFLANLDEEYLFELYFWKIYEYLC